MFTSATEGNAAPSGRSKINMIDPRFFCRSGPYTLAQIATAVGGELANAEAADRQIFDIAAPECATPETICVFNDMRYRDVCRSSSAQVFVTSSKLAGHLPEKLLLVTSDPRLAYARIAHLFYPTRAPEPYIDPNASVAEGSIVGDECRIEAGAVVGQGAVLGARCQIGAGAVVEAGVQLGDDCRIGANVSISHAKIGARTGIAAGTTIGGAGFGFVPSPNGILRIPQLGRVVIGADVEIGNNCTIDRGALGDTVIGDGTKIDNLVHLAHNVRIGRCCIITAQVGIAGSATVGDGTMIGGQVAIADHVHVGAGVRIVPQSGIMRDIPDGETVGGSPALPVRDWHRQTVAIAKLAGIKPGGKH